MVTQREAWVNHELLFHHAQQRSLFLFFSFNGDKQTDLQKVGMPETSSPIVMAVGK